MAVLVDKPLDIPRFYAGDLHEEGGHEVYICELLGMLSVFRGRNLEERAVKLLKEFFLNLGKPGDVSLDGKLSKETKIRIAEPRGHLKIVLLALLTESVVPVVFQKEALNTLMGLINPKLGQHFDNDLYFRLLKAFILSSQPSDAVLDMLALMINQHSHMRYFTCLNVLKLASDLDFNKGKYQQGNDQQPTISMRSCQTLYHLLSAVASGLHKGCMICACSQGVSEGLNKHMEVEAILLEGLRALMQLPLPVEVHEMMRAFLEDVDSNNRVGKPDLSSSLTPCMVQKMVSFNWGLLAATLEHNGQEKLDANEEKVGDEEGGDYEEEEEEGGDEEQGGNEEEGEEEEDEDGAGQDGDEDEDDQEEEDEEEYEEEDEEEDEDEEEEEEDDENEEETEPPKKKKK